MALSLGGEHFYMSAAGACGKKRKAAWAFPSMLRMADSHPTAGLAALGIDIGIVALGGLQIALCLRLVLRLIVGHIGALFRIL